MPGAWRLTMNTRIHRKDAKDAKKLIYKKTCKEGMNQHLIPAQAGQKRVAR
jgi:hypothetical protein